MSRGSSRRFPLRVLRRACRRKCVRPFPWRRTDHPILHDMPVRSVGAPSRPCRMCADRGRSVGDVIGGMQRHENQDCGQSRSQCARPQQPAGGLLRLRAGRLPYRPATCAEMVSLLEARSVSPMLPPRRCGRCGRLVSGRCSCRPAWSQSRPVHRISGRKLQRLRDQLFNREPICQHCGKQPSTIRDHIIPLAEGGADNEQNVQALCNTCSDAKTAKESQRGRQRVEGQR